jgi:PRC-barrel domain
LAALQCRPAKELSCQKRVGEFIIRDEEKHMAMDEKEFGNLIGSDKVEGTAVYGADDNKIGSIERVMIDKVSGRVSYAVLGFGGFLGIGNDHYPLPWQSLKYDTRIGGYRTGVTEDQLRGAPKYKREGDWNWGDRAGNRALDDYYGVTGMPIA